MSDYYHKMFVVFPGVNVPCEIPVPPANIAGTSQGIMKSYEVVSLGEVLTIGGKKLENIQFQSFFPYAYDNSLEVVTSNKHILPEVWRRYFTDTQKNQEPLHLSVLNTSIDDDYAVAEFKWNYAPGISGDMYYQITLNQFKQGTIRQFDGVSFPALNIRPRPFGKTPSFYTVGLNQSLTDISMILYGSTSYAADIFAANWQTISGMGPLGADLVGTPGFDYWATYNAADPLPLGMILSVPDPSTLNVGPVVDPTTSSSSSSSSGSPIFPNGG